MRTPDEIEDLKRQWLADPVWDIEDTEGFEGHRDELLAFRLDTEEAREIRHIIRIEEKAEAIGCLGNRALTEYVLGLEFKIKGLMEKIDALTDRLYEFASRD